MRELGYFLNIDKPAGVTSRDVVNQVVRFAKTKRVGHAGTLDPLATGVLVVAVERATRLVEYVQQQSKTYDAQFRLGETSDTDDSEGEVEHRPVLSPPREADVRLALRSFVGEISQLPPKYSALKIGGRNAYDLARRGMDVDLKPRLVQVNSIELLRYEYPVLEIRVVCGSGTYIRSIARDLGEKLGTGGIMSGLRRTAVGVFQVNDAVLPANLAEGVRRPLKDAVVALPFIFLDDLETVRFSQGKTIQGSVPADMGPQSECAVFHQAGLFLGIARPISNEPGRFQPIKGGFATT